MRSVLEKQIVRRTNRLIRVRKLALQEHLADNGTCYIIVLIAHPGLCNVCCPRAAVPG
jgi:rRNA pseudouridine-1189 N-methylase Emg1 (Nep1/Mra1 family)